MPCGCSKPLRVPNSAKATSLPALRAEQLCLVLRGDDLQLVPVAAAAEKTFAVLGLADEVKLRVLHLQHKKENNIMFRTIRKKKNEISIDTAKALLQSSRRGVLAVNGDDGYPYAIPINYVYDDDAQKIYFHGARAGHKVDALCACDKVCFTVYGNETIKEEDWAPFVQSVVVFGRCHLVESGARATTLLKRFAMKYYPSEQLVDEEIAHAGKAVQIFEIDVEYLSGKEIQER